MKVLFFCLLGRRDVPVGSGSPKLTVGSDIMSRITGASILAMATRWGGYSCFLFADFMTLGYEPPPLEGGRLRLGLA